MLFLKGSITGRKSKKKIPVPTNVSRGNSIENGYRRFHAVCLSHHQLIGGSYGELHCSAKYEDSRIGVAFRWMRAVIFYETPPTGNMRIRWDV